MTVTTTFTYDPATFEDVVTVDGVETSRTPAPAAKANRTKIENRAAQALTDNATYLAIGSPSAAQNAAQVKALTRQVNGLIRATFGRLDVDQ